MGPQVLAGRAHAFIPPSTQQMLPQMPTLGRALDWALGDSTRSPCRCRAHGGHVKGGGSELAERRAQCVVQLTGPGFHPSCLSSSWDPEWDLSLTYRILNLTP